MPRSKIFSLPVHGPCFISNPSFSSHKKKKKKKKERKGKRKEKKERKKGKKGTQEGKKEKEKKSSTFVNYPGEQTSIASVGGGVPCVRAVRRHSGSGRAQGPGSCR
jgi:hypothetical protein